MNNISSTNYTLIALNKKLKSIQKVYDSITERIFRVVLEPTTLSALFRIINNIFKFFYNRKKCRKKSTFINMLIKSKLLT